MHEADAALLRRLDEMRRLLLTYWDPLRIGDDAALSDEYDFCLPHLVALLRQRSAGLAGLHAYLLQAERELGCTRADDAARERTVRALAFAPDARAEIELFHDGRSGPTSDVHFGCPIGFGAQPYYDAWFNVWRTGPLVPGGRFDVEMAFLAREQARRHLVPGARFELWEGGVIGAGVVRELLPLLE